MNSGSTLTLMSIDSAQQRARRSLLGLLAELPQGTKLPGERLLAEDFGVCRMTMRRAIEDLLLDGRLERHARSGTYVRRPIISSEMRLKSFTEELKSRGMVPSTEVISLKKIKANKEIAKHLQIREKEDIYVATRLRLGDGTPIALETLRISCRVIPHIMPEDLRGSIYEFFEESYNVKILSAKSAISAYKPKSKERELLKIADTIPCLLVKMIDLDQRLRPVMLAECLYRSDLYEMQLDLSSSSVTVELANRFMKKSSA